MVYERAIIAEALPRGWIVLVVVALGLTVFVALLVMLLITGHGNQHSSTTIAPVTPAVCYPFCTVPPNSPPPGWQ
jgi:ABC-type multidrug transport system permease subunit